METSMRACVLLVLVMAVLAVTGQGARLRTSETNGTRSLTSPNHKPTCLAFKKLGDGFCREKLDHYGNPTGTGTFNLHHNVYSKKECAELCHEYEGCTGYEYDEREHRKTCEVHRGEVGAYEAKHGVECYEAYITTDTHKCFKPPAPEPPTNYCKFELVGHGYCREAYDHYGYPYGTGDYKTYCNAKKPCLEEQCKQACAGYDWCHYYEFQDVDPENLPHGTYLEPGAGRCELYKSYVGAYKPSSKAVCYKKAC